MCCRYQELWRRIQAFHFRSWLQISCKWWYFDVSDDISPESCHLLLLLYSSTLLDLHKKVVAISVFSKVGILTFGRECFNARWRRNYFVPLAIRLRYLWSVEEELNAHDVRDGHINSEMALRWIQGCVNSRQEIHVTYGPSSSQVLHLVGNSLGN